VQAAGVGIGYLDGPRLSRGLLAASDWVWAGRDDLNRINVFPVPDGDTGTNLSLTLRAVADALRALGDATLSDTAQAAARAAVLGARGNSGMMVAQFFLGMSRSLTGMATAGTHQLAAAIRHGAATLEQALDDPREGTIVTVARDASAAAEAAAGETADLGTFLRRLLAEAERVLAATPELMEVLRQAGVVDAGGKGFVRMIEGVVRLIDGREVATAAPTADTGPAPAAWMEIAEDGDFRYCTEVLVRGDALPAGNDVRAAMHPFGGSVVVAVVGDVLKIHVHTDTPDAVFRHAEQWGLVTARKADDMRAQHRRLRHPTRRNVTVVVDSSNDLDDATLDRLGIIVVPHQVIFGDAAFRDRVDLKPAEFYRRLREATELPTTSQPAPAEFVRAFRAAREEGEEVVGILVASALSGTLAAAQTAVQMGGIPGVSLLDSRTASLGIGMLALRASELADEGWGAEAIVTELARVRGQSGALLSVATLENLRRSGRVSRGAAMLGNLLAIRPILQVTPSGTLEPVERVWGRESVERRVLTILRERLTPRPRRLRLGVVHADAPGVAATIAETLRREFAPREVLVGPATGVIGTHVGIGAWAIFYQVEDGTPEHAGG
jgi:hypothetical protein